MMLQATRKLLAIASFACITIVAQSQSSSSDSIESSDITKTEPMPFKVLTSGKLITIKSSKNIKSIMVWTASGHRIVEQKDVNASTYNFRISVNEKIFFVMLRLIDGKIYSEKIGVR
jgi:hypothetical protein